VQDAVLTTTVPLPVTRLIDVVVSGLHWNVPLTVTLAVPTA
jgi:hypothetical protein